LAVHEQPLNAPMWKWQAVLSLIRMAFWENNVILVEVALARDEDQSMKRNRLSEEQISGF
jgi:hypothetical protein